MWSSYVDDAFNCQLEYPVSVFKQIRDEEEGPVRFAGPEPEIYFRVMGAENPSRWTVGDIKTKYLSHDIPDEITYERIKGQFLVLSGYRGEGIFYTKVSLSEDGRIACILEIAYPRQDKIRFDRIVTRMSRSFSAHGA